ncbi:MAG: hypothetical protein ACI83P_001319, partial [Janthinobacterium sp.]
GSRSDLIELKRGYIANQSKHCKSDLLLCHFKLIINFYFNAIFI